MAADSSRGSSPGVKRSQNWSPLIFGGAECGCGLLSIGLAYGDERVQRERSGTRPGAFPAVPSKRSHPTASLRQRRGKAEK